MWTMKVYFPSVLFCILTSVKETQFLLLKIICSFTFESLSPNSTILLYQEIELRYSHFTGVICVYFADCEFCYISIRPNNDCNNHGFRNDHVYIFGQSIN